MKKFDKENVVRIIFFIIALFSILAILLISFYILGTGVPFVKEYGWKDFLLGREWKPSDSPAKFGIFPMILGSIYVTIGSMIIGVPIGIFTALYMVYYAKPKVYEGMKSAVQLLAGIPSILYGFFALIVIVPWIRNLVGGTGMNLITVSILLGIMILPTIISLSETAFQAVPRQYYEGSIALGATKETTLVRTIIPAAKSGLVASVILGIGRAIGETMAVVLVAGNQPRVPTSITDGVRTMTTNIVMDMAYAAGDHKMALIATAAVLFIFILIINLLFAYFERKIHNE